MLEVLLPTADASVTGLKGETEAIDRPDRRPAYEAGRITEAVHGELPGRAGCRGGDEEASGEAGRSPKYRPEKKLR